MSTAVRRVPAVPPAFVERHRLDHLYARADGRAIRVLAPSGYGKTSLVARWMAAEARSARWVDIDHGDDDAVALFRTLQAALSGLVEVPSPSAEHSAASNAYVKVLGQSLITRPASRPWVLVLDDVHRLTSAGAAWLVSTLIECSGPDSTVVLVGRGHHDHGSIGRLRLSPGVVDIGVRHLAFDESESHRLFEQMGLDPCRPEVADVLGELEGWAAGIRLAGQVVRSGVALQGVADHVSLVDFLRDEWIGQLEEEDRTFMREVACLQAFTGEKCEAVLRRQGCAERLRRLHRDQVVVFALDDRDGWYRLHGLLRRWLSDELRDHDPERWTEIHMNAAQYWEERGDADRAVQHVLAAGDLAVLERMVIVHGGPYFTRGLDATVERWLSAFSPEHVRTSPGLCGLQCIKALHQGDDIQALQWLRLIDRLTRDCRSAPDDPTDWWGDVLHAALDERPAGDLIPLVAKARANLAGGPWAAFACWLHGALAYLDGDLATARDALRAGVFEAELARTQLVVGHCLGTLSIVDDLAGDEVAAREHADLAADAIQSCGGELCPPAAVAMAAIALRQARQDDRDAAARSIELVRTSLVGFRSIAPWFNIIARVAVVRAALLLDDRPAAREVMQELEHHARVEPPSGDPQARTAMTLVRELRSQVEAMHVPAIGSTALTDAELRVLHLLPTNLSLAEIATQLFLSRNTVKSHAASIYRKLDATKRADAVERARAAGLLASTTPP